MRVINIMSMIHIMFFLLGKGVFAGSIFYGSHRLIAVFRSPLTRGLHVSAVGGAAYSFMRTGVDAICMESKSELPSLFS